MRLKKDFFNRPTLTVAKELLGKYLVRVIDGKKIYAKITETEAYIGEEDLASHARFGKTKRNEVMYGPPGVWYVYLIYGMYWMLNVITEEHSRPAAVLIRAVVFDNGTILNGPGKLTRYLKINKDFNLLKVSGSDLYLEDKGVKLAARTIKKTARIGVDYAGEYKVKPWRFIIQDE
ncbi:MAG: DNA-3-methyladenine glycosylase [Candidatus Doudnabacteria bacterium]